MKYTTNLWDSKNIFITILGKGLLALVILLYFTSCDDDTLEAIGSSLQDEGLLLQTAFTDTLAVESFVTYSDSVATSGIILVGSEFDEKFGHISTEAYFKIFVPPSYSESFTAVGNNAIFDSAAIIVDYRLVSGEATESQVFEAYTINEFINDSILYYQMNSIENVNPTPIGSTTIVPEEDSLRIMRMRVDSLGNSIFALRSSNVLATQPQFEEEVLKGVQLKVADPTLDKYTINLNRASEASNNFVLRIYFSLPGDTISRIQNFFIGFNTSFYHVDADFSNSAFLSGLTFGDEINTELTGNEGYFQAGVGISTKITFPQLENFTTQNRNIAINKAELSFDPVEMSQLTHGNPPTRISFFALDRNGNFNNNVLLLQEGTSSEPISTFIGINTPVLSLAYNSSAGTYPVADITTYIQDILNGNIENNGLMINPFSQSNGLLKCIFGDNKAANSPLKLKLFYTSRPNAN